MNFWDDRFNTEEYIFGRTPSQFVQKYANRLAPNSDVFLPADGEGRNSVYLAQLGHNVHAFDYSPNAIKKAESLAQSAKVNVDFQVQDILNYNWPKSKFDAAFAVFIQFAAPPLRDEIIENIKASVKIGGMVFLHGYTPKQLEYKTGGPSNIENLYTSQILCELFDGFEIIELSEYEQELDEGAGHKGMSALIDLAARRKF